MTDSSLGSGPVAVIRARAGVQLGTTQWPPRLDPSCLWPELVAGMRWIIWLADHPSKRRPQSGGKPPLLQILPSLAVRMLWLEPPALSLVVGRVMGEGHGSSVATRFSDVTNRLAFPPFPGGGSKVGVSGGGSWFKMFREVNSDPPCPGSNPSRTSSARRPPGLSRDTHLGGTGGQVLEISQLWIPPRSVKYTR